MALPAATATTTPLPPAPVQASFLSALLDTDLKTLQSQDPAISTMIRFLSHAAAHPPSNADFSAIPDLKPLFHVRHRLQLVEGLLVHVSDDLTSPTFVAPRTKRGVMLTCAHDSPSSGHRGIKATCAALWKITYWPHMKKDVAEYVKSCIICCPSKSTKPVHRPQRRENISDFALKHLEKSAEHKSCYDQEAPKCQGGYKEWHYTATQPNTNTSQERIIQKFLPHWSDPH
ncbi:hypothetical protein LDENG_00252640, partial [Lucifuga dentata]